MEITGAIKTIQAAMDGQSTVSLPRFDTSQIDSLMSKGLTTQAECDQLRSLALAMPSEHVPATPEQISNRLDWIRSTLPAQNQDIDSGQKRVVVYTRLLGSYSDDALAYLVRRACAELNWFPTPKQCLDILAEYPAPVSRKNRALRLCELWTQAQFDQFVADLRDGPVPQSEIDSKPERWRRICVETGLLRRKGDGFVQSVKISSN